MIRNRKFSGVGRGFGWLNLALAILVLICAVPSDAYAYTDPGSGALIWQGLVAGFIGAMFYFRRFISWFKAKRKDGKE